MGMMRWIVWAPMLAQWGCNDSSTVMPDAGSTRGPVIISGSPPDHSGGEVTLAVAPDNVVAVAWMDETDTDAWIGYAFSRDHGESWELPATLASAAPGRLVSDPVLAAAGGRFQLTWLDYDPANDNTSAIYAASAATQDAAFGAPVAIAGSGNYDKPWIAVAGDGTLLVTYTVASAMTSGIAIARSSDGQRWTRDLLAEDGIDVQNSFARLCVPPSGNRVYATYFQSDTSGTITQVMLARSDDAGATWPVRTPVAQPGEPIGDDDCACVTDGDRVWVSYGLTADLQALVPRLTAVRVARSSDSGATVDQRADAHDGNIGPYFLHPQLALEASGALDVVYYAGARDGDPAATFRRARSSDGGRTFGPSVVVDQPITFTRTRTMSNWLGDYNGLAWAAGRLYTAYANNSAGVSHVAFYRVTQP
jgi:hypothetical protein